MRHLTEGDHSRLRDAMARLFRLESVVRTLRGANSSSQQVRDDFAFAVPDARIPAASTPSGTIATPGNGDATFFRYYTDSPAIRFDKLGSSRGKMKLHNMHRGMWLWDGVVYACHRDHHSGMWFAVQPHNPQFKGRPAATIAAGSSGTMNVYRNNTLVSGLTVANVRHDWMAGGASVTTSTDCVVTWFPEDQAWTITEALCP